MLGDYRVLDLCGARGMLCGQLLADLGADVILVEPPGGAAARGTGPFLGDVESPERSLEFLAFNRNKRSLALDLDTPEGRAELRALAGGADFVIESEAPGAMARRGLGYAELAAENPGLIYVSITPFGQQGPKAQWAESDLIVMAAGGPLALGGEKDRPPVRLSVPQAWCHAATDAALGALVALNERLRSGRGQHVDVSAQQSVTACTQGNILASAVGATPATRAAGGLQIGDVQLRLIYPAKDGYVTITHVFGSTIGPITARLMEFVHDSGFCDAATRDKDWVAYGTLLASGAEPIEEFERVKRCVADCTRSKSKAELLQAALDRRLLIAPVATLADVAENEQLAERCYFQEHVYEAEGRTLRHPGPFAKFAASPIRYRRRAPRIGEHGDEIRSEPARPRREGGAPAPPADPAAPLAGLKIVDFMWALAGPAATRALADFGATIVRVESSTRLDVCRTLHPFQGGSEAGGTEKSALFHTTNAGKLMLTLDLTKPEGRAVALDLVRWADVVTESFSPRGMRGLGLDYEQLRAINPELIMLSTCLMGQTGPLSQFAGFGNLAAAICGFYEIAGWPDRDPAGPYGAYTDYMSPRYNAIAVLAALEHRRRTGRGQHIDLSQAEAALHFLGGALLDHLANDRTATRIGNDDAMYAPHGVYPAVGEDRWIAIAVLGDAEWRALCEAAARPELASDPRYASSAARLTRRRELDALVAGFTRSRDAFALQEQLQARGVAAHVVQNSPELVADPQLLHRGHFLSLPHEQAGVPTVIESARFRLSRTPACVDASAPTFGRDSEHVLRTILGYDDERIAELAIAGALE
jgi:crotonobetainyl-CoA:carnitine CoA-transferase CaiB-like acyl-CoA transferase